MTNDYTAGPFGCRCKDFVFALMQLWKHPCAQVIFDSDPAQKDRPVAVQLEEMSQAMIRCEKYSPSIEETTVCNAVCARVVPNANQVSKFRS